VVDQTTDAEKEKEVVVICGVHRGNGQGCANMCRRIGMCLQRTLIGGPRATPDHQRPIHLATSQGETPCWVCDNVSAIGVSVGAKGDDCWYHNC
jgi:hypothetical protein